MIKKSFIIYFFLQFFFMNTSNALLPAPKVVKLLVQQENNWPMAQKFNLFNDNKHLKLEFFGGRVNNGEDPLDALKREVDEEDYSGLISKALNLKIDESKDSFLRPKWSFYIDDDYHYIYLLELTSEELSKIEQAYEKLPRPRLSEISGVRVIDKRIFLCGKKPWKKAKKGCTRRTKKIIKQLRDQIECNKEQS